MYFPHLMVALQLLVLLMMMEYGPRKTECAPQQMGGFELPVQLVGFPVIIIAVRLSNFLKQLTYALNPRTYQSAKKQRRDTSHIIGPDDDEPLLDVVEAEKRLVAELGEHVCVYERVCTQYAQIARQRESENHDIDWENIFKKYETSPDGKKQFYLLSVFLGDIVQSPRLCHQLAKRGRSCEKQEAKV